MQLNHALYPLASSQRTGTLFIHREDLPNTELIHHVVKRTIDVLNMNPHTVPDVVKEQAGILAKLPSLGEAKATINHFNQGSTFWKTIVAERGFVDLFNNRKGMVLNFGNRADLEPYFQDQISQVFPSAGKVEAGQPPHQPVKIINIQA